ncbi:helix-turn-helix domain-containing protein [Nonomuraea sp. NPDC049504]|uniref:helix-turn-helix transcriptional regulator n=1 Tax=Nonomuraea sp. NPDC049504 TaxID=3154729 RepID=UPI003413A975
MTSSDDRRAAWTFLTHHARVLIEIARNPETRTRGIAARIGITERAVHSIVTDLHQAGYLTRERIGRRNRYTLDLDQPFRYRTEAGLPVRRLIALFTDHDLHRQAD